MATVLALIQLCTINWYRNSLHIVYSIGCLNLIFDILKCTVLCYDCFDKEWTVKDTGDNRITFPCDLPIYSSSLQIYFFSKMTRF